MEHATRQPVKRASIQTRITVILVLLMVAVFALTAFAAAQLVASTVEELLRTRIATLARFISGAGIPLSERTIRSMGEVLDVGLATVSADFQIRQSNLEPALAGALSDALRRSPAAGGSTTVSCHTLAGRDYYVAFCPVGPASEGLVLLYDAAGVRAAQWEAVRPILIAALVAVLLANLAGWFIARSITGPLRALAASTARVAAGDLSSTISVKTGDELAQLAGDFNCMIDSLRTSREELLRKEKLATLGSLAAGIAHEIRNPLTSMKMTAEMLSAGKLTEKDREGLGILLGEIERLRLSTGALLDYARPTTPQPAEVDVGRLAGEVLALMRRQLTHRSIEVAEDIPADAAQARIDPNRLKQAILNLLLNAAEAMPEGGRLRVTLKKKGGSVELCISDTGRGIPEGDAGKVFEPFYSTRSAGCGLGLAISRRFIEEADGTISFATSPSGTTFTLALPKAT